MNRKKIFFFLKSKNYKKMNENSTNAKKFAKQSLKINKKYVEAIENGNFNLLPKTYARLFIKSYAKINLSLGVVGKTKFGLHKIESLVTFLNLFIWSI